MTSYDFIFSDKPSTRVLRHVSFWIVFSIHFFIQSLLVPGVQEALTPRTPLQSFTNISYFIPIYVFSVYIFIEFLIPRLLFRNRYTIFFFSTAALLLFNFAACYLSGMVYEHLQLGIPYSQVTFAVNKYHGIVNGGFVSVILLATAGGVKIAKKWFQKQRENEALARQKISSELQLLKIQINPRFLFHSLHSVKKHILANSPQAPKLILQVADLLSYILYESDQQYVQLEKELAVMMEYIKLEENAVPENLQMNIDINGQIAGKYITPLILLSLIEASFEYFLEKRPIKFSSKLFIEIGKDQLNLRLVYKSPDDQSLESIFSLDEKFQGVRKQVNNLYQDNYRLLVESKPGRILIALKDLPLHNKSKEEELQTIPYSHENV